MTSRNIDITQIENAREIVRDFVENGEEKIGQGIIVINATIGMVKDAIEGVFTSIKDVVTYANENHMNICDLILFEVKAKGSIRRIKPSNIAA